MRNKVKEICREEFENEPSEIEEIEGGLNSHTFRVSVDDEKYIFQIGETAEPHELENCVKSFEFLEDSDVPVPRVVRGLKEKDSIYYTIVEFIEGDTLGDEFTSSEAEKAGEILGKIHNFHSFSEAGWIEWDNGEPVVTGFPGNSLRIRIKQLMSERTEFFEDRGLEKLAGFARRFRDRQVEKVPEDFNPVFVHHDFNPGNTLAKNGEITAILDFDYAHSSHPHRDLAKASNKFWLRKGDREDLYRGYRKEREIGRSFRKNEPLFRLESLLDEIGGMLDHDAITEEEAQAYLDELERLENQIVGSVS